jgi:hypothetical protein
MNEPCAFCGQHADTDLNFEYDYSLWYSKRHYKNTTRSKRISVCTPCKKKWHRFRLAPWGLVLLGVGFMGYFILVITPKGNDVASANSSMVGLAFLFGILGLLGYWIAGLIRRNRIMRWLKTYYPDTWQEVRRGGESASLNL